jgi:meromycolic acid enoyl-[acyl-carrier-protein] reductase
MGILEGKNLLITGVLTDQSIAFHVARLAQQEGANLVLSSFGRALSLTNRIAGRLPTPVPVVELDVTDPDHLAALVDRLQVHVPSIDGVLHSIGYAPGSALGGNFLNTEWDDVATALQVSAFSLKSLTMATLPLMVGEGRTSSVVGLTFDATVAWPKYDWMGVAKAAFESTSRYLARDLGPQGVRVNLVAAGPIGTIAAKSIPGFEEFKTMWDARSPIGWDVEDPEPAARACVALFSDWFPKTTAEIIHVDGGVHAIMG